MHGIAMINKVISSKRTLLPEIQSSEIEWIGYIPKQWKIKRGKFLFRNIKELNTNNDSNILSLTLRGVVNNDPDNPEGLVPNDYTTYQIFQKNDLVFKLIDLENFKTSRVGIVPEKGVMSSAYIRLIPCHSGVQHYFYLQYFDLYQRGVFNQLGGGVRSTLSSIDLLEIPILVPSNEEQSAIVKYLDHADQMLRGGVSQKMELVELMEEYKRAVIQQAVTRGLDPDVPLKPSEVEWLGDIPEHWEASQVKRHYSIQLGKMLQNTASEPSDTEVLYLKAQHVQWFSVDTNDPPTMWASPRDIVQFGICSGDLLVCEGGEGGRAGLVKDIAPGCIIQNALHRVRPLAESKNEYLQYVMSAIASTGWFEAINNKATIAHFTAEKFGALVIPVPPPHEQISIVAHLDKLTSDIDAAIAHTRREIELLEEYRTRLIADVVTGKLDVREAVANLPDVDLDDLQPLAEGYEADD